MNLTKRYSRLEAIMLPEPKSNNVLLFDSIKNRISQRNFSSKPISLLELSTILFFSAGITHPSTKGPHIFFRSYPSAGAKYPVEIYVLVQLKSDIPQGVYHYDPFTHALDNLLSPVFKDEIDLLWLKQKWFKNATVIIFMTGIFQRTTDKYGIDGLAFPYIEAGHIAQNTYLISQSMNIKCCTIGQLNESAVLTLLDINPTEEALLYSIALGK